MNFSEIPTESLESLTLEELSNTNNSETFQGSQPTLSWSLFALPLIISGLFLILYYSFKSKPKTPKEPSYSRLYAQGEPDETLIELKPSGTPSKTKLSRRFSFCVGLCCGLFVVISYYITRLYTNTSSQPTSPLVEPLGQLSSQTPSTHSIMVFAILCGVLGVYTLSRWLTLQ